MNVLITGANGFIGRNLLRRLLQVGSDAGRSFERVTCIDTEQSFDHGNDPRVRFIRGTIADPAKLAEALEVRPDVIFHLATLTSARAEREPETGWEVNVLALKALLDAVRIAGWKTTVVFPSSIAVYGAPLPSRIDDLTPVVPALTYGAYKQICEILLADYSRRNWIESVAVRLPGIVVRPSMGGGAALSAFNSDVIRHMVEGVAYVCPVSPDATVWQMSLPRCLDNLIHAVDVARDGESLPASRVCNLPAIRTTVGSLVDALVDALGSDSRRLIAYQPNPEIENQFGRFPELSTPTADRLGFATDGDISSLIERARISLNDVW